MPSVVSVNIAQFDTFDDAAGVSDILIDTSSLAPTSTPIRVSTAPVSTAPISSAQDVEFLTILMELKHDLEELHAEVRACRAELKKLNKTSGKVDDAKLPMQLPLTPLEEFVVFEG
ncbi:uncharacterized protein LOC143022809 isoform X2 [Oratosquilla oratoria]|uniref:uncharacterized protein LOC143022809 isoform X2 n=1 Tax=Oratosquilla oratoria TaxID=337810 RepID=UPI003F7649E4